MKKPSQSQLRVCGDKMLQLLREISEISAGQGAPQGDSYYCTDGIPFVKAGNLQALTSGCPLNEIQKVSEEVAKKYRLKLYPKGTLLFAKSGMSCLKGYVFVLPSEAYVVSHLACITPKEDISEYLRYYFRFHKPSLLVKDASYPSISLNDIGDLEVDIKDSKLRASIVSSLKMVERIINLKKLQLGQLNNLIKARFIEMFGDIKEKEMIGVNAKLQGGYAFKSKDLTEAGVRLVQIGNVNKDNLTWDDIVYVPHSFLEKYSDYKLNEGDVVLAMTRPIIKSLNEVKIATVGKQDTNSLLNQRVGKFVLINNKLNMCYLLYCCKTEEFKLYVEKMSGNSLQPNISSKQVEDYKIPVPPIELQNEFSTFVQQIDKSKVVVQKSSELERTCHR